MRIAYITAGAAGMICGSCLHDNTLVAALQRLGHDALLIPTYTPIRTDEVDVSQSRVFLGGINVYLQQKFAIFRRTPWFFDRLLDVPRLLRWVSRFAIRTSAEDLGPLTLSMLRGDHGHQRKEIDKLTQILRDDVRPEVLILTNVLLSGLVPHLRKALGVPIVAVLQGDDIFLESLPETDSTQAKQLIAANCRQVAGFIASSRYYADFMAPYLTLPRERIEVVYPGINLNGHGDACQKETGTPFTIGYFARIAPEKGLHILAQAFEILKRIPGVPPCRLRISGWLGDHRKAYLDEQMQRLQKAGWAADVEHCESPDHASKVRFLQSLDVLSVPTVYHEPKGIYILEAWANGVPVVQPRHGSFPELIEATGGGLLVEPNDPAALAQVLREAMDRREQLKILGRRGQEGVGRQFSIETTARETLRVIQGFMDQPEV